MIDTILSAIATAIYKKFGDEYNVYTNPEEQGVSEPCFFVYLTKSQRAGKIMGRYLQKNLFHIVYFPRTEEQLQREKEFYEPNEECYDVLLKLNEILEFIITEDGNTLRGTSMSGEVSDKHLSFWVNYDLYLQREETLNAMETISQSTRKK